MNRLVVLVGAHSSGKTTLGKALSDNLGWQFDDEIGYRLRMKAVQEDPTQLADVHQSDFDRSVCLAECHRDSERHANAVVETWHGGNLAYIVERSPEIYTDMREMIRKHLQGLILEVVVVPLQIQAATLQVRQREVVSDVYFFHKVGQLARTESQSFNVTVVEPVITDQGRSIEACLKEIEQKITAAWIKNKKTLFGL